MSAPALLSPTAERDLQAAVSWIRRDNPSAALRFRSAIRSALQRIGEFPDSGFLRLDLMRETYRTVSLTDFPFLLSYDCERRPPALARILHGARDLPEVLRDL